MSDAASMAGVSLLPRGVMGRRLAGVRARLRRPRLDVALARGADPWSAPELMLRASRLSSLSERRKLAAGLATLVGLAEHQPPASPHVVVRHRVVLEQRESLLALAERLGQPAPVEVAAVARLAMLVSDPSSPAYAGGQHPASLAEALEAVWEDVASG